MVFVGGGKIIATLLITVFIISHADGFTTAVLQHFTRSTSFFTDLCKCTDITNCQCCLQNVYFNQSVCVKWELIPKYWKLLTTVTFGGMAVFSRKISADDAPPICLPSRLLAPFIGCVKVHSFRKLENGQHQACTSATVSYKITPIYNKILGCLEFGWKGLRFIEDQSSREQPSSNEGRNRFLRRGIKAVVKRKNRFLD